MGILVLAKMYVKNSQLFRDKSISEHAYANCMYFTKISSAHFISFHKHKFVSREVYKYINYTNNTKLNL